VKRLAVIAFFCLILAAMAICQSEQEQGQSGVDQEHTQWIANALRSIQTIKAGMTRSDLMKVFTTEGGLEFRNATTSQRTYVYRKCPYIKVDVKMTITKIDEDLPTDKIMEISRPYLQWTVAD
jgi:hypothetical protein